MATIFGEAGTAGSPGLDEAAVLVRFVSVPFGLLIGAVSSRNDRSLFSFFAAAAVLVLRRPGDRSPRR